MHTNAYTPPTYLHTCTHSHIPKCTHTLTTYTHTYKHTQTPLSWWCSLVKSALPSVFSLMGRYHKGVRLRADEKQMTHTNYTCVLTNINALLEASAFCPLHAKCSVIATVMMKEDSGGSTGVRHDEVQASTVLRTQHSRLKAEAAGTGSRTSANTDLRWVRTTEGPENCTYPPDYNRGCFHQLYFSRPVSLQSLERDCHLIFPDQIFNKNHTE